MNISIWFLSVHFLSSSSSWPLEGGVRRTGETAGSAQICISAELSSCMLQSAAFLPHADLAQIRFFSKPRSIHCVLFYTRSTLNWNTEYIQVQLPKIVNKGLWRCFLFDCLFVYVFKTPGLLNRKYSARYSLSLFLSIISFHPFHYLHFYTMIDN